MDNTKLKKFLHSIYHKLSDAEQKEIENIFPEFKESEDERIRKVLYGWVCTMPSSNFEGGFSREEILAWLEKQNTDSTPFDWNDYKDKPIEIWNAYIRGCYVGMERGKQAVKNYPSDYGLEKQGETVSDPRCKYLDELLVADDIHQMAMNDAMIEEAKEKAIKALSKLGISKLILEKYEGQKFVEQHPATNLEEQKPCKEYLHGKQLGWKDLKEL